MQGDLWRWCAEIRYTIRLLLAVLLKRPQDQTEILVSTSLAMEGRSSPTYECCVLVGLEDEM